MRLSLSEIVTKVTKEKTQKGKIAVLQQYDCVPLRQLLRIIYDKSVEVLLPDTTPPWNKNDYVGVEGMLYKETRRLRIFLKGGGYDHLDQVKRENLFIKLLEDVDNGDAELLTKILPRKPLNGLTEKTLLEAFPDLYETKLA